MRKGKSAVEIPSDIVLRHPLQVAIGVIQAKGGRLTVAELQAEMDIGLSTAYTYLNELLVKDLVDRIKIQGLTGNSKQFLYILKYSGSDIDEQDGDSGMEHGGGENNSVSDPLLDKPGDPLDGVLDILSHLTEKVRMLENQFAILEQEKLKHYPLISALKKTIESSN